MKILANWSTVFFPRGAIAHLSQNPACHAFPLLQRSWKFWYYVKFSILEMLPHILKGKKSHICQTKPKCRLYLGTALISATVAGRTLKKECHSISGCKLVLLTVQEASNMTVKVLGQELVTIQKASRLRRWWRSIPKKHLTQVRIQVSFILKGAR